MSRSYKKNLIGKAGRWMKKGWSRLYRAHVKRILKRDQDDINIEHRNAIVNCYNITDQIYFCEGSGIPANCWCGRMGKEFCRLKNK